MTIRGLDLVVQHLDDLLDFVTDRVSDLNYGDPILARSRTVIEYPAFKGGTLSFDNDTARHAAGPDFPADSHFVGMVEYTASIHDLLEDPFSGDSSSEVENPEGMGESRECFVVDVANTAANAAASPAPAGAAQDTDPSLPRLTPEQQEAHQRERVERHKSRCIDEEAERARLDREQAELRARNVPPPVASGARVPAHQTDPAVIDGGGNMPYFTRAGQNIAAAAMLLRAVPEPNDPEARQTHRTL